MKSSSSSRLNLSSPIYQSPIRAVKRNDTIRLPIGLNPTSFRNEILLSERASNHFDNFENENEYTQRKVCCPNCRYLFNLAIDQKILDVLSKEKTTQTDYGEYEYQRDRAEEKINEENERTAKELGMKVKSVLLMEKLIDMSKSRAPKVPDNEQEASQSQIKGEGNRIKQLPYESIKWKQIQVLLRYAHQYLKDDVPIHIKMMFEDRLLWGDNKVTPPSSIIT